MRAGLEQSPAAHGIGPREPGAVDPEPPEGFLLLHDAILEALRDARLGDDQHPRRERAIRGHAHWSTVGGRQRRRCCPLPPPLLAEPPQASLRVAERLAEGEHSVSQAVAESLVESLAKRRPVGVP